MNIEKSFFLHRALSVFIVGGVVALSGCGATPEGAAEEELSKVDEAVTDSAQVTIPWTPGAGVKDWGLCRIDGYFAYQIQNVDLGKNTVSNNMICGRIDDYLPAGTNINQASCFDVGVTWTPGAGAKGMATCGTHAFAVGFRITDYGGRNEGISAMHCCGIAGRTLNSGNLVTRNVSWTPGAGPKAWTDCGDHRLISGIELTDYGGNNQGVSSVQCAQPL